MSVDTKQLRKFYLGCPVGSNVKADINEMCDEIDRLRDLYNKLLAESKEMSIGFLRQSDELKQVREQVESRDAAICEIEKKKNGLLSELVLLREQLRPRSIKDEPPPDGIKVHGWDNDDNWFSWKTPIKNDCVTHWLPYPPPPPAPPPPDAFAEWVEREEAKDKIHFTPKHREHLRYVWDAALESSKGKL